MNYDDYTLTKKEMMKYIALLIISLIGLGIIFYESIFFIFILPVVFIPLKKKYEKQLMVKRKDILRLQFKDLMYSFSASFATGRHMDEALFEAKENLTEIYGEDSAICIEIGLMLKKIRESSETDINVLHDFSKRSKIEDIEAFTEIFRACRETGGNIITSINKAAAIIGEKITIESEIKTMVLQKKYEGRIITLMPIGIILFLRIMSPDYLEIMYITLAGRVMMSAALGITAIAYLMIERITEIEV